MFYQYIITGIVIIAILDIVSSTAKDPELDYELLYKQGVDAYLENNWGSCVSNLEWALDDWHWWRNNLAKCRGDCSDEAESVKLIASSLMNDSEIVNEKILHSTLCLIKCKKKVFGARMDKVASPDVDKDFHSRKIYDYLQLCYFQTKQFEDAANAAVTVLSIQPDHELMKNNLEYYLETAKIDPDGIVDLEQMVFSKEYALGDAAYQDRRYSDAVDHMERGLASFWEETKKCRLLCEAPFDQGWFPDFVSSVANHYTFTKRCKRRCRQQINANHRDDFAELLPAFFDYLQYSYYKVNEMKKATEAVASYLILDPENPTQNRNKHYYLTQDGITEDFFVPRKEVVTFKALEDYEVKLLNFIDTEFNFFADDKSTTEKYEEDIPSITDTLTSVLSDIMSLTAEEQTTWAEIPKQSTIKEDL